MTTKETYIRIRLLQSMDFIVTHLNNEDSERWWLMEGVPDGADMDDFIDMAEDDGLFEQTCTCFWETISQYGGDGFYTGGY